MDITVLINWIMVVVNIVLLFKSRHLRAENEYLLFKFKAENQQAKTMVRMIIDDVTPQIKRLEETLEVTIARQKKQSEECKCCIEEK